MSPTKSIDNIFFKSNISTLLLYQNKALSLLFPSIHCISSLCLNYSYYLSQHRGYQPLREISETLILYLFWLCWLMQHDFTFCHLILINDTLVQDIVKSMKVFHGYFWRTWVIVLLSHLNSIVISSRVRPLLCKLKTFSFFKMWNIGRCLMNEHDEWERSDCLCLWWWCTRLEFTPCGIRRCNFHGGGVLQVWMWVVTHAIYELG